MSRNFHPGKPKSDPFQRGSGWLKRFAQAASPTAVQRTIRMDDMHWRTRDGELMLASEMNPHHLFYALRLLYNKVAPAEHRIACENAGQKITVQGDAEKQAMKIFFKLLSAPERMEKLTDHMLECLLMMRKVCVDYL